MEPIGRYQIEREIGRGAMGVVYAGFDPMLRRRVAVKTVLPASAAPGQPWETLVKRLAREAQAAGVLNHPNIVAVYDVVQTGGMFSVVMEFVDGKNLAEAVPADSRAPVEFILRVLKECGAALDHAHSRGVIHRDVKPANIMLDRSGTAKIADFGVAKLLEASTDLSHGFALGTLEYMSPEQLSALALDGRSDQYALAVVAYRLLTGSKIFDVDTVAAWCYMVSTQRPKRASQRDPNLPRAVDSVLDRGMAKTPVERYESCSKFVEELTRALSQPAPLIPASSSSEKTEVLASVAVLLAAGAAVYFVILAYTSSHAALRKMERIPNPPARLEEILNEADRSFKAADYCGAIAKLREARRMAPGDARPAEALKRVQEPYQAEVKAGTYAACQPAP